MCFSPNSIKYTADTEECSEVKDSCYAYKSSNARQKQNWKCNESWNDESLQFSAETKIIEITEKCNDTIYSQVWNKHQWTVMIWWVASKHQCIIKVIILLLRLIKLPFLDCCQCELWSAQYTFLYLVKDIPYRLKYLT